MGWSVTRSFNFLEATFRPDFLETIGDSSWLIHAAVEGDRHGRGILRSNLCVNRECLLNHKYLLTTLVSSSYRFIAQTYLR